MSTIKISGPGLLLTFEHENERLILNQIQSDEDKPILYEDQQLSQIGRGPVGNPLTLIVYEGEYAGIYNMNTFTVHQISSNESRLLAYLKHDAMPLEIGLEIRVEGHVATWRGQAIWNGDTEIEMDIYFPLLSRVRFSDSEKDRGLVAQISGAVLEPLREVNFRSSYIGNLSCPVFLVEGGGRGLAVLDDNRADFAPDPGACALRSYVIGNRFMLTLRMQNTKFSMSDDQGPFVGICHTRLFKPASDTSRILTVEDPKESPMRTYGDSVDLGPIRTYTYKGSWKIGADWLRSQRRHVSFRVSPAHWYQRTSFISEDMGDSMVSRGQSFYDYPKILAHKRTLGSDLFHIPGFHDPEILGTSRNWLNRGDYFFAAQNLGGFEAVRQGIDAIHRQGGHILYYVEGLIMWKRSRIGRSKGKDWALMKADGSYDEHYKGFWHMCPACKEWCEWIAQTCAEIVRTTGVDGFFVDSSCATHNHRCFNPAHKHPHPDVWNWGVRQMLRTIREAVDKINPETIIFVEGAADIAREFVDGSLSHGHSWTRMKFHEPFVRFLHSDMRAYESWTDRNQAKQGKSIEWLHVWNSVTGHRIYAHNSNCDEMAQLSLRTRRYYDAFPEICDNAMSVLDIDCHNCMAYLFHGSPYIITVGNLTDQPVEAQLGLPVPCGILFDRVDSMRVPVIKGNAILSLSPWEFRAFEVRE